jgi:hypothetical protein
MKVKDLQFLTALRGGKRFLVANDKALGTVNQSGARKALDTVTTEIESLADTQGTHRMRAVGAREKEIRAARTLKRRFLGPIVKIARAKLPDVAEFKGLALPPANGSTAALASFAVSLAGTAEAFAQTFIDAGLAPDFADQTRAAAAELVEFIGGKGDFKVKRVDATKGIGKQVREAKRAVSMLDSLIKAELAEDDSLLAAWASARLVIQRASPTDVVPPAPAPSPVPASEAPKTDAG